MTEFTWKWLTWIFFFKKKFVSESEIAWNYGGLAGKESACHMGDLGLIPGLGRCPGEWDPSKVPHVIAAQTHILL